jgi:hypothetical protein
MHFDLTSLSTILQGRWSEPTSAGVSVKVSQDLNASTSLLVAHVGVSNVYLNNLNMNMF